MTGLRTRALVLAVATLLLLGGAVGYALTERRAASETAASAATGHGVRLEATGRLLFLSGLHVASVAADAPGGTAQFTGLGCVRVYAAAGTGICLHQDNAWKYSVRTFDDQLEITSTHPLPGLPNRARVSPSGRMVAWTSFIGGESYNRGGFSTRTGILDTVSGKLLPDLEAFRAVVGGRPDDAADHNIWGVTFVDDNAFYATLSTHGSRYLVRGDIAARTLTTLAPNVECPSLSPDGTRVAFKQAIDDDPRKGWRLSVLRLDDLRVTHLAETRSIDDQAVWLSDDLVGYTVRGSDGTPSIWSSPADGSGAPALVRADAESPAPLR